ncbi:MAG: hypothetical protein IPP47_06895 [Bryobacterales bacterium]|nr:hypothetical protein [Bryobacterales bacterium]
MDSARCSNGFDAPGPSFVRISDLRSCWKDGDESPSKLNDADTGPDLGPSSLNHSHVMGEEDRLNPLAGSRQSLEGVSRASVVEGCEDIITNKWGRLNTACVTLKIGKTKCQVELIARAGTHSCD